MPSCPGGKVPKTFGAAIAGSLPCVGPAKRKEVGSKRISLEHDAAAALFELRSPMGAPGSDAPSFGILREQPADGLGGGDRSIAMMGVPAAYERPRVLG